MIDRPQPAAADWSSAGPGGSAALIAIHDYRPRSPGRLYNLTQPGRTAGMKNFARISQKRCRRLSVLAREVCHGAQ